jgi:parvulin-like peptidyl-prolyl isomerase
MRTSILCALVLTVVLFAVGCGGGDGADSPPPTGETTPDSDDKMEAVLATVGDQVITLGDVYTILVKRTGLDEADEMISQPDILQVALGGVMDQYVWAEMARREGFRLTAAEERRIATLEAEILATRYVADVVQGKSTPSDEMVREYYNEHQHRYVTPVRIGARHILVSSRAEAERIKGEVESGQDFGKLARRYSLDTNTKDLGGAIGYVVSGKSIPGIGKNAAFEEAVMVLEQGEVTIVETEKGWHLVIAEKREGGTLTPLDEVFEEIREDLGPRTFGAIYQQELSRARDITNAKFDPVTFEFVTGIAENPGRLMLLAEQQENVRVRLETYRRVAYDFMTTKEASRAQFMLGYTYLTGALDKRAAERELLRLQTQFSGSRWRRAGDYLLEHLDDDPEIIGTPDEILKLSAN